MAKSSSFLESVLLSPEYILTVKTILRSIKVKKKIQEQAFLNYFILRVLLKLYKGSSIKNKNRFIFPFLCF